MRETLNSQQIVKKINKIDGCKAIKLPGGQHLEVGTPDILMIYKGKAFLIENKSPGNFPSEIQLQRLKEWEEAGATCLVLNQF